LNNLNYNEVNILNLKVQSNQDKPKKKKKKMMMMMMMRRRS